MGWNFGLKLVRVRKLGQVGGPTGIRTLNQRIMLYHFGFRRRLEAVRGLDHAFAMSCELGG